MSDQAANPGDSQPPYRKKYEPGSELLGHAASDRRVILGLTQEDVAERFGGPSIASLRTIENSQSDSYRAKTLLSLDRALSWPRGASMTLLSGELDRLDRLFKLTMRTQERINLEGPSVFVADEAFDKFVEYIINRVSKQDIEKYDLQVYSAVWGGEVGPQLRVDDSDEPQTPSEDHALSTREGLKETTPLPTFEAVVDAISAMSPNELKELGEMVTSLAEIVDHLEGTDDEALRFIRKTSAMKTKIWHRWQEDIHKRASDG